MAETTRPKPQLSSEAIAAARKVRTIAPFGVCTSDTSQRRKRDITGACASAWPVARIRIIWKAKVRISKMPRYQLPITFGSEPWGAIASAKTTVTMVSPIASTKGSGM